MMVILRYGLLIFIAAIISGCGYHVAGTGGHMPGEIKSMAIPIFQNKTTKPDIESIITGAFRNEFVNNVHISDTGEAVFTGIIKSYTLRAVSFTRSDVNQEYRLTIAISASITKPGLTAPLWIDEDITANEDFIVNINDVNATKESERRALVKISADIARLTKERIVENF